MENEVLISVIIPVYNAQKTVERCVQSLYQQDYKALQIILVDDGSKDDSFQVMSDLYEKDARIVLVRQENKGCAEARNAALLKATGKYYIFLDADDTMQKGALKKMLNAMHDNDLLIAHYHFVMGKVFSQRGLIVDNTTMDDAHFMPELLKNPGSFYFSALWNKLYRGDIIRENHITFDNKLTWGEDFAFNMCYYMHVKHVRLLPFPVYNYYKAPSGISVRALMHVKASCKIKWELYLYYKALCVEKNLWDEKKARIRLYILNVTLND